MESRAPSTQAIASATDAAVSGTGTRIVVRAWLADSVASPVTVLVPATEVASKPFAPRRALTERVWPVVRRFGTCR